tara:strand:- start:4098 stop:4766 length:669 start_codon:yes stop_codon:yes gene_type:complete
MKRGHEYRGLFVSFEGGDGSGKSTQFRRACDYLEKEGYDVVQVREPGGTSIGEQIRDILLDVDNEKMAAVAELLLYGASRAQLVDQKIRPALEEGKIVCADRFFDSSTAYQGSLDIELDDILRLHEIATQGIEPDRTYLLDVDLETASKRVNPLLDRIEARESSYHERVRRAYQDIARVEVDRVTVVDGNDSEDEVEGNVRSDMVAYMDRFLLKDVLKKQNP